MSAVQKPHQGELITFYSYKGGTGRSMALANAACLLAEQVRDPRGVLMLDWDLEAPGLHQYFASRMRTDETPGLIELLCELREAVFNDTTDAFFEKFDTLLDRCVLRIETGFPLWMVKSGRIDSDYATRVQEFNWEAMFHRQPTIFTRFAHELGRRYRYVLIDARTGVNDSSGICSILMPEKLVLVFTPNRQSLDGVLEVARKAIEFRKGSPDLRPLTIFPLASRIESGDSLQRAIWRSGGAALSGDRITGYQLQFEHLLQDLYGLDECNLASYFDDVQVQHDAFFAYGERVAVLENLSQDRFSLADGYRHLVRHLRREDPPWSSDLETFDVFLAYDSKDQVSVRHLDDQLRSHGLNPWFDGNDLPPGSSWESEIERAIRAVNAVAICVADATLSASQEAAMTFAHQYSRPIVLIILEDFRGESLPLALAESSRVDLRDEDARAIVFRIRDIVGEPASRTAGTSRPAIYAGARPRIPRYIERRTVRSLGDLEKTIASSAPARDRLIAAAELHHAFSFDRVSECDVQLDYEPRCSASCADHDCQSIWVGSKAGEILRLSFTPDGLQTAKINLPRGVRSLVHVHRESQLVVGLDSGHLVVLNAHELTITAVFHFAKTDVGSRDIPLDDNSMDQNRFKFGITAILELPRDNQGIVDLVVATRSPELLVIQLAHSSLRIRGRYPLPGWTRCLTITGLPENEVLVCVTRGGEFLQWDCRSLLAEPSVLANPKRTETNLLPTAVVRPSQGYAGYDALLVGASDGLHIRSGDAVPVHVAVTAHAVLSIATVTIPPIPSHRHGQKSYVVLGLEDGRLRVIEEHAVFDALAGRDVRQAHDFTVDLGNAALAVEIVATGESASRFVFAALRDHTLRLFHVRSREALLDLLDGYDGLWRYVIAEPAAISASTIDALLKNEQTLRSKVTSPIRENALRYLLVDEVLPRWTRELGSSDPRLIQRACQIADGADAKVLYRLSATMREIAGVDARALIQLSMACLVAMPQRDTGRWRAFVLHHLKQFHACARRLPEDRREDFERLQHWARFVRKYLLLGKTFADKRLRLERLVERNTETRKFLDALIYAARLERQRFDLKWSKVVRSRKDGREQEIARVELLDDVAIAITVSGEVVFFDDLEGEELPIMDGETCIDRLVPLRIGRAGRQADELRGLIRTRAARVVRKQDSWVRIAVSWVGEHALAPDELPITIFDLELPPPRAKRSDTTSDLGDALPCSDGTRRTAKPLVRLRGAHIATCVHQVEFEVHGLVGLEGADAFLVGLDSSKSPLALLRLRSEGEQTCWELSPLTLPHPHGALDAVLSTPVRAVAAIRRDRPGRYLAGAGADDGSLRFVEFDLYGHILAVSTEPTPLVYPVNDIAFAVRYNDEHHPYVCYAGTENGLSLCLLLHLETRSDPHTDEDRSTGIAAQIATVNATHAATAPIVAKQLWRDLHSSPVVAIRTTKRSEAPGSHEELLYETNVVFVATQAGRVCIYNAEQGDPARISASFNYYFEGMRFDRIDLPEGLTSWASPRSRSKFLAAYPSGELCFGKFVGPRESKKRDERKVAIDQLYQHVMAANVFFGAEANEEKKLAICAMIRIDGGAPRSYVLRKQLERANWKTLEEAELDALLDKYLEGLRPDMVEQRDLIKVVVHTVSRNVLDRHPNAILDDLRKGKLHIERSGLVRRTCERLTRYLIHNAVQSRPGPVRVRMVIITALFRANLFRHMGADLVENSGGRLIIIPPLQQVLTLCLRDENRTVRVESLRAVAVALRNISVLLAQADEKHRKQLRRSFFPYGLETIQWLVSTLLENSARHRRQGEPPLLSTQWSYVAALVAAIRLFPGNTLELCEQISRRGLGDSLELIAERLRGKRVAAIRWRIRELWLVPSLRQPQARIEFIRKFQDCDISQMLRDHEIGGGDDDFLRARGLLDSYRRLALCWNVNHEADIANIPVQWRPYGDLPEFIGSLASMAEILDALLEIARAGRNDRIAGLAKLRNDLMVRPNSSEPLPDAVRLVVDRVIDHWEAVLEPRIPTTGQIVLGQTLRGILAERGNGLVYAVRDPKRVVKVLRYPMANQARHEFNRDARLSRELAERYESSFVGVHDIDPTFGYAAMDRYQSAREWFQPQRLGALQENPEEGSRIASLAGIQLARALRCLHVEGLAHGDLRAKNVFVSDTDGDLRFRLGDLHAYEEAVPRSTAALLIPSFLRTKVPRDLSPQQWIDIVSLTLFLQWILTGSVLEPDAQPDALTSAVLILTARKTKHGDEIAGVIADMLGGHYQKAENIEKAIETLRPEMRLPPFVRKRLAGRVLAKFDVFISYDSSTGSDFARGLYDQLTKRGLVPYLDARDAMADQWWPAIAQAMDQSRAFAILVGDAFRADDRQAREVSFARSEARTENLPFHVFLLGEHRPNVFADDGDAVVPMRNAEAMADRIVQSFK